MFHSVNPSWLAWFIQMSGMWTVTWSNGNTEKYIITPQGMISINGGPEIHIKPSESSSFPASQGWFYWIYNSQRYYIRVSGGSITISLNGETAQPTRTSGTTTTIIDGSTTTGSTTGGTTNTGGITTGTS